MKNGSIGSAIPYPNPTTNTELISQKNGLVLKFEFGSFVKGGDYNLFEVISTLIHAVDGA